MENKEICEVVYVGMEVLIVVFDMMIILNVLIVKKVNDEFYLVGFGVMNLYGYLVKNKIVYESVEVKEFVCIFFMMLNYYFIEKSMEIVIEKGEIFKDFDKFDYVNGIYFEKYEMIDYSLVIEKV